MIEKEQWPTSNSSDLNGMEISCLGATQEAIWNLHLKPKIVSEFIVALHKILENFPQVQLIKLSRVLRII